MVVAAIRITSVGIQNVNYKTPVRIRNTRSTIEEMQEAPAPGIKTNTMTKKDKQFYRMIIRECKITMPYAGSITGLCAISAPRLREIIKIVTHKNNFGKKFPNNVYFSTKKGDIHKIRFTPKWKSDRIFLLNEISRYCKFKLNGE